MRMSRFRPSILCTFGGPMETQQQPGSKNTVKYISGAVLLLALSAIVFPAGHKVYAQSDDPTLLNATSLIAQGRQIFRFDTFGDEAFWGDTLKLHQAIEGSR